jgi:hypothetical protein
VTDSFLGAGTVHLVDLHATLLDLGGAVPQHPAGTVPIDGVSLVQVLNGSVGLTEPVRSELWIADDVLRVGAETTSFVRCIHFMKFKTRTFAKTGSGQTYVAYIRT